MKLYPFLINVCGFCFALFITTSRMYGVVDPNFHLFLFIGQSNMAAINTIEAEDMVAHPRVFKFTTSNSWAPGAAPIQGTGTNPARTCGNTIADANPDITVGLVSRAVSGSEIASWRPGLANYDNAIAAAKAAQASGVFKGVFWHQGEADGSNDNYPAELAQLIENVRRDLNEPNLPFIMGMIGTVGDGGVINNSLGRITNSVPYTAFASCQGMVLQDNIHYNAASQRIYGERYARAYLNLTGALPAGTFWISPVTMPLARRTVAFNQTLTVSGSQGGSLIWKVYGTLPNGITFNNGQFSGTPTSIASPSFSVEVSNGTQTVVQPFSIRVEDAPPASRMEILNSTLHYAETGKPYSERIFAYSNAGPITWSLSGTLPAGITIADGVLGTATGFTSPGKYSFTIKAEDSTGSDSQTVSLDVFEFDVPSAIVNFNGVTPKANTKARSFTLADDNTSQLFAFDDSITGKFFTTGDRYSEFRGGFRFNYDSTLPASPYYELRLNDSGYAANQFIASATQGRTEFDAILVWPSDLFAQSFSRKTVRFGNTADTASFRINLGAAGVNGTQLRFVIREGSQYYVSEQLYTAAGLYLFTDFQNNSSAGKRWAAFDPQTAHFPPSTDGLTYTAVDFQNVTAVGFYCIGIQNLNYHVFNFDLFTVKAEAIPVDPLIQWQRDFFEDENVANAAWDADPDHDGYANLWEYALNQSPLTVDATKPVLSLTTSSGSTIATSFLRPQDGIYYRIESSTDLVDWSTVVFDSRTDTATLDQEGFGQLTLPTTNSVIFYRLVLSTL